MKTLKDYCRTVSELEAQLYTQETIRNSFIHRISSLESPDSLTAPAKPVRQSVSRFFSVLFYFLYFFFFFFSILLLFNSFFIGPYISPGSSDLSVLYTFLTIGCFLFTSLSAIPYFANLHQANQNYHSQKEPFAANLRTSQNAVSTDAQRRKNEPALREALQHQLQIQQSGCEKTRKALDQLYSMDILSPKYRSLVAASTFFEYLDSGRCSTLTGPNGAYAVYENDVLMQRISNKLDTIINGLNQIIDNQHYLATLLQDSIRISSSIDRKISQMPRSPDDIIGNSVLTEYNAECSARSIQAIEDMHDYEYLSRKQ